MPDLRAFNADAIPLFRVVDAAGVSIRTTVLSRPCDHFWLSAPRVEMRRTAFTLVELLVVVGIVAALVAVMMPTLARARAVARTTQCASNLHQIAVALTAYASVNRGRYPPNTSIPLAAWYDDERIGVHLPVPKPSLLIGRPGGGAFACPEDAASKGYLSYAVNVWCSSRVDASVLASQSPVSARLWSAKVKYAAKMILAVEAYSGFGNANGYYAAATVGQSYATAGAPTYAPVPTSTAQRFGAGGGILYTAGRFRQVTSELCFNRHRTGNRALPASAPKGRLNIAYADGHVDAKADSDLVTAAGLATGDSFWSPTDIPGN